MTQEAKHTPGPWKHTEGLHSCEHIYGADGYMVAEAGRIQKRVGEEAKANARLIASAPELLEALREMLSLAEGMSVELDLPADPGEFARARAIIAKAIAA